MTSQIIIGLAVGGGLGLGWYKLVGCPGGACPLTRHPLITMIYGAVMGVLVAVNFR